MADLIPTPALPDPPLTRGGTTLALTDPGPVTAVAAWAGQVAALDAALQGQGLGFPAPGQMLAFGGARMVWTGRDQAFLIGAVAPDSLGAMAALTDQTDGWACLSLTSPDDEGAGAVLVRLVALDLRRTAFPPGTAARTTLNHLPLILWREDDGFRLMLFRSMARTGWHEIAAAMAAVAARAGRAG